ncbi:MAG: cytochrome b [Proteobacteria bacterium]|nr:cytochrome b [Pseudomonadota bacterium]
MAASSTSYSKLQIALHWLIATLVVFQLLAGESMTATVDALADGGQPSAADQTLASVHYWIGLSILVLALFRLGLRATSGTPVPDPATPSWMALAAKATHWAFYGLLFATPITGLLAYYLWDWMGDVHALAKPVFIAFIGIHAAAALFHHFVLRDTTLRRILVPSPAAPHTSTARTSHTPASTE